ncbi:MAG: YihA family ribosome biogenesis GTP-binding protein [Candidatus Latescibacteria bacterium]|nr:YihA family ribosome biogenesis GTP-binding protein [Candidatus Latescibacterota bacterium]
MKILSAEFILSAARHDELPRDRLPEVAFAGRSNVGKSSLLNALLHRKHLAKTSSTPGKTRLLNCYRINEAFYFIDLPGYGYARVPVSERQAWGEMAESYITGRPTLRGIVHLLDVRHNPTSQDMEMVTWLLGLQVPFLLVATKSDKLSSSQLGRQLRETHANLAATGDLSILSCSARTGAGLPEIWRWIENII